MLDASYPTAPQVAALVHRGYTGHEQLDEVGLIHMNGRMYDIRTGRFTSADPHVQYPGSTQNHNRYAYVQNNPLKYTDPSGYFLKKLWRGIKKHWRTIVAIAVTVVAPMIAPTLWMAIAAGFTSGMVASGGDWRAGLIGAAAGGLFHGVGTKFANRDIGFLNRAHVEKILAHGVVGGAVGVAQGGKFGHGFLSSGFAQFAAPGIDMVDSGRAGASVTRTLIAAATGGVASSMGGGKFANGALTGAFSRAFNDEMHESQLRRARDLVYRSASVIGGTGQIMLGGAICSTAVGCAAGAPIALLGASNIQEGLTGENGFVREASISTLGDAFGNLAVDAVNIGSSIGGLLRPVLKPGAWKLFHYIRSDYVPHYAAMTNTGLTAELYSGVVGAAQTIETYHGR